MRRVQNLLAISIVIGGFTAALRAQTATKALAGEAFVERIPGTIVEFTMVPIPAGTLEAAGEDGTKTVEIPALWFSETEVTWDLYDVWVYELDAPVGGEADGASRPSRPYIPPDRGFGHAGYPAISLSRLAAIEFCKWLSELTGKRYRLPTPEEWEHAARAGATMAYAFGDDGSMLDEFAWFAVNAPHATKPVRQKQPNAWGLYDMHGNVAEWAVDPDEPKPIALGGSWKQDANGLAFGEVLRQDHTWQESDPQIPKSTWWLSDCGFVGIRLVCEGPLEGSGENESTEDPDQR